mgnify:CR=1 FL=1
MSTNQGPLLSHFANLKQQYETSQFGMWSFLLTEVLFFGGLFTGYAVYRTMYYHAFVAASLHLDIFWGTFNTAVLIASSLTMALAVHAGHAGNNKAIRNYLIWTLVLGTVFLGVKCYEYMHKWHENLIPGEHFHFPELVGHGPELFFSFYFMMTGLHAVHMIIGEVALIIFIVRAHRGRYSVQYSTPIEIMGLYWHFVDLVWIFLFPFLYLVERHH